MILPSIKKPSLNINEFSSYRPVTNLAFLSKVIEKAILEQLDTYLFKNDLYPPV